MIISRCVCQLTNYPDGSPYTETDTREKLINPALYDAGWTENHLQRERSPGAIVVGNGGRGKHDTYRGFLRADSTL